MIEQPELILGSRNPKKAGEIRQLLAPHGVVVRSISEFDEIPDVLEDGLSFAENAAKKAREPALLLQRWVLAEDSGLMVDALNGAPGIYSARYAGEQATDAENNTKLIASLQGVTDERRDARYVCHVAVADPSGRIRLQVAAACRGRITPTQRGTNGFGYDPYFLVREYWRTFGELAPEVKSHLSHRARAFERLIRPLVRLLNNAASPCSTQPRSAPSPPEPSE